MQFSGIKLMICFLLMSRIVESSTIIDEAKTSREIPQEYCQFESFRAQCLKNEVVLMQSATYGRMRIGKCVKAKEIETFGEDPRYLGCSVDVLDILDQKCSGKTNCEFRVSDLTEETLEPCFSGLKMYLEASYKCISVADERRTCVVAVSRTPIHVNGSSVSHRICGTKPQPWIIKAPVGQKLIITLLDFGSHDTRQTFGQLCLNYSVIVDKAGKRNVTICGGGSQRERQLYLSSSNTVDIFLDTSSGIGNSEKYSMLVKLEAVGCSDIVPPEDTWLKRSDDTIVIGCYSSRQTWYLSCREGKWTGVVGNCSLHTWNLNIQAESDIDPSLTRNGQVLAIVAICGFTMAICFTIMCIGAICLRKYYIQGKKKYDYKTLSYADNSTRANDGSVLRMPTSILPQLAVNPISVNQAPTYSVYQGQDESNSV